MLLNLWTHAQWTTGARLKKLWKKQGKQIACFTLELAQLLKVIQIHWDGKTLKIVDRYWIELNYPCVDINNEAS